MNIPYTYLLGWSKLNKYYYGVRYSKNCHPSDLWNEYFTSSNYVKEFVIINGNPDIIQIRNIFMNIDDARKWEHKVLRRMKVTKKFEWLNKTDNISIKNSLIKSGILHPLYGRTLSREHIEILRRPKSEKTKEKLKGKRPHVNQTGEKNNAFKRLYITPWGKYPSVSLAIKKCPKNISKDSLRDYCINNDKIIVSSNSSKYFSKNDIGKTRKELGYYIEMKRN